MLPFWKVLDNSDSTDKTSVSMYRAAIQSGDFNFFNSPSAVASSASSLKHKSMESRSSWAAFTALSKDNHRVLHAFWRCFLTFFLPSVLRWTCFSFSSTLVYTERRFGELSKNFHSCRKFVSTLPTWAMSATEFHSFIVIFLGHFCPRGKGAMRLSLCEAPTRETRPDHNTGNYAPYSFR